MSATGNSLAEFLRSVPYEVKGQWFHKKTIGLDGYAFVNCRFDGCHLYVSRGVFRMKECYASGCTFYYLDEALNIVRLFAGAHVPSTVSLNTFLRPVINADGTFTIDSASNA
jgi:hypothetical protein